MKISIEKIFSNLKQFLLIATILASLLALMLFMESENNKKTTNLLEQKDLLEQIATLGRKDIDLSIIQFEGKGIQLLHEISQLSVYRFDFLGEYIYNRDHLYENELKKLYSLGQLFIDKSAAWYQKDSGDYERKKASMLFAKDRFNLQVNKLIEIQTPYEIERSFYTSILSYATLLTLLIGFFLFSQHLQKIYADLKSLFAVDVNSYTHTIMTEEVELISRRIGNRQGASDNTSMVDSQTELLNYKGLIYDFSERKIKSTQSVSVFMLQIDHFDALDKKYSTEFINIIIRKVAFVISLFQQNIDLVSRIDQQIFVFVLMRKNHETAVKDCDKIIQTIAETRFKIPRGESVPVTASGVLILKAGNVSLSDTIKQLQALLPKAAEDGGNRIVHDNRRPKIL